MAQFDGMTTTLPAASGHDGYVSALLYLASYHGRAVTREALLMGLPLESNDRLDATLLERAALNARLEVLTIARPLDELPALVLPAILIADERVQILLRKDDELEAALGSDLIK